MLIHLGAFETDAPTLERRDLAEAVKFLCSAKKKAHIIQPFGGSVEKATSGGSMFRNVRLLSIVSGLLILSLIVTIAVAVEIEARMNAAHENKFISMQLANELRQSSQDLTRLARTYVVTGEATYKDQYWDVVKIRAGEKERPDGRKISLTDLMKAQGFSSEELGKLDEAGKKSNNLIARETKAMNAVEGLFEDESGKYTKKAEPDLALARKLMHDEVYHKEISIIMEPISEFGKLLTERTYHEVMHYIFMAKALHWSILALTLMLAGTFFLLSLALKNNIKEILVRLQSVSETVFRALHQLNESGESLSASSAEGASSMEETVASLEEIASLIKNNTSNASQAATLAQDSEGVVNVGKTDIHGLIVSMGEVAASSSKMDDIIQVIDDIAFQTNLLSLNASVEAARAGEQGKGFSVVAEAVRELAQRSAQSAKEISVLIKDVGEKIRVGTEKAEASGAVFSKILGSVGKVSSISNEISSAAQEQSTGIGQISTSMNQLDQITQSNAAAAEEIAATVGELKAQGAELNALVAQLGAMVSNKKAA